jgi:hypothetical protein
MGKTGRFSKVEERNYYTSKEMAQMLGTGQRHIRRIARTIPGASQPTGRRGDWKFYKDKVVPWLEKEGRKPL